MSRDYHHTPWADRDYTHWSEIETARQCLAKHNYTYKRDMTWRTDPPAIDKGNRWHALMEDLYTTKDAAEPYKRLLLWAQEAEGDDTELERVGLLQWMLEGYYEKYGLGDPQFVDGVVDVELEFYVELPDVGGGKLMLRGAVDVLVELWGKLWLVDHKSGVHYGRAKKKMLDLADQWTLYTWALREMGYDVFGSIHNHATTTRLKRDMTLEERFHRTPVNRTERELEAVVREAAIWAWHARADNGAPRSPDEEHCFRKCSYLDVCVADRKYGSRMADNILLIGHRPKEQQP